MGIPGLTTYINNHSDRYLKYHELYDTYLVIDGNSVGCQIYNWYTKCNSIFGGDYDKYARAVSTFFDNLLKCDIKPLVLLDGAHEDKKLKTVISRTRKRIHTALTVRPPYQQFQGVFPLLRSKVFTNIMDEKNIKYVQCLFEADNDIAAVARTLDCPVLSYDSDFYIYGSSYIAFNTLSNYVTKRSDGNGYMICCKIYKVEFFLNSFKGLNQSAMPLAAVLLGNDYVKRSTFKKFFRHMKWRVRSKKHGSRQCCIEMIFTWLSNYTLDKAVIAILSRLHKPMRQSVLNIIETNINGYTNVSAEIFVSLGLPKKYVTQANTHSVNRIFQFQGDINNLTIIQETCEEEDSETCEEEDSETSDKEEGEIIDTLKESKFISTNVLDNLPAWFINEVLMAKHPTYFLDLIVRRLYISPIQIEDSNCPSSIVIGLKIIRIIFRLLMSGVDSNTGSMKYMTRNENRKLVCYELDSIDSTFSCELPPLCNLRECPINIRRDILNNTLKITDEQCINELPPKWILYVACIKYWTEYNELYRSQTYYLYSLLVCMLHNIICSKIGNHRFMYNFNKKYEEKIETIKQKRMVDSCKPHYLMNVTITDACNEIDRDDCLLAAPFFASHYEMDKKLCSNPKKFNVSIVHAFAEFQSCLYQSMNLNTLLGCPYPDIKIANLFNGTLLYNLCNNFKTRNDIEVYISTIFKNSPSILRFFQILLLKVKPLFTWLELDCNTRHKKQRTKDKHKKSKDVESDAIYVNAKASLN